MWRPRNATPLQFKVLLWRNKRWNPQTFGNWCQKCKSFGTFFSRLCALAEHRGRKHNGATGECYIFRQPWTDGLPTTMEAYVWFFHAGFAVPCCSRRCCLGLRSVFSGKEESFRYRRAASPPILYHYTAYWPGMYTAVLTVFCGDASHLNVSAIVD